MAGVPLFARIRRQGAAYEAFRTSALPSGWATVLARRSLVAAACALGLAGLIAGVAPFRGPVDAGA